MKSIRTQKIILTFLLLLIAFNNIAETTFIAKATNSRRRKALTQTKTKTKTKTNIAGFVTEIQTAIRNIPATGKIPFILGFLSVFIDVEGIIESVIAAKDRFNSCVQSFESTPAKLQEAKDYIARQKGDQEAIKKQLEQKQFCLDSKKQVLKVKQDIDAHNYSQMTWYEALYHNTSGALGMNEANTVCATFTDKTNHYFVDNFGDYANYVKQCKLFATQNCDDYEMTYDGLMAFVSNSYSRIEGIALFVDCAHGVLTAGGNLGLSEGLANFKQSLKDAKYYLVSAAVNFGLHVLTFGLWGTVKAAYYYVQLYQKIRDFKLVVDPVKVQQLLGAIVGYSVMIIKSLLTGRRRKFRKSRK